MRCAFAFCSGQSIITAPVMDKAVFPVLKCAQMCQTDLRLQVGILSLAQYIEDSPFSCDTLDSSNQTHSPCLGPTHKVVLVWALASGDLKKGLEISSVSVTSSRSQKWTCPCLYWKVQLSIGSWTWVFGDPRTQSARSSQPDQLHGFLQHNSKHSIIKTQLGFTQELQILDEMIFCVEVMKRFPAWSRTPIYADENFGGAVPEWGSSED